MKELHSVRFGGSGPARSPQELAALFRGKAEAYAQDLSGVQTFEMLAFYDTTGHQTEPMAFFPFKVTGQLELGTGSSLETEAATEKGLAQQAMRHSEASFQIAMRAVGMSMDTLAGQVSGLLEQNRALMAENGDSFRIIRQMMMERMEEDKANRRAELEAIEGSNMKATALRLAPALINTITGKNVFPQATADTALIETIAAHVSPDQLAMLGEFLPPSVAAPLLTRFEQILQEKQDAEIGGNVEEELGSSELVKVGA